jgi:hypothetical protein
VRILNPAILLEACPDFETMEDHLPPELEVVDNPQLTAKGLP